MTRFLPIIGIVVAGCAPSDQSNSTVEKPVTRENKPLELDFSNWPRATQEPYPVSPYGIWCGASIHNDRGPHERYSIVVRVNTIGIDHFKSRQPTPVGTIVVKEKYKQHGAEKTAVAVAAMIKRESGYDSANGDWEYSYEELVAAEPNREKVKQSGKITSCINCHNNAKNKDYMFRPYLR